MQTALAPSGYVNPIVACLGSDDIIVILLFTFIVPKLEKSLPLSLNPNLLYRFTRSITSPSTAFSI